jgi:hypothetical protein
MNNTNIATVRTTWNGALVAGLLVAAANVFGWSLELADLTPWLPVIAAFIAVFYRLSLAISEQWPKVGWVLFGKAASPSYRPLPPSED